MNKTHSGISKQSAIIMIAFVSGAVLLSSIGLTGFSANQNVKSVIQTGLQSIQSLRIAGTPLGLGYVSAGVLNATNIPISVEAGSEINLAPGLTTVSFQSGSTSYNNIYGQGCLLNRASPLQNMIDAIGYAVANGCLSGNPFISAPTSQYGPLEIPSTPTSTKAIVWFSTQKTSDTILQEGEIANVLVVYGASDRPTQSTEIKIQVITSNVSILTLDKIVPSISSNIVDMG